MNITCLTYLFRDELESLPPENPPGIVFRVYLSSGSLYFSAPLFFGVSLLVRVLSFLLSPFCRYTFGVVLVVSAFQFLFWDVGSHEWYVLSNYSTCTRILYRVPSLKSIVSGYLLLPWSGRLPARWVPSLCLAVWRFQVDACCVWTFLYLESKACSSSCVDLNCCWLIP